jgi:PBP1b-binding outer membrane lipoprotein LpoB
MKKLTLLLLIATLIVSCGKNKGEQMLYDYQQNNVKALNFDLADLDFEIKKVEKINNITASDSLKHLKKEFAGYWTKDAEQSLVDTLSFKYVKSVLNETITQKDTLYKLYQESVLTAIRIDDYSYELESKRKRDKAMDEMFSYKKTLLEVETLEKYYNKLAEKPDSILSSKYKANYSLKNPMLGNTKQTFEKEFYTDATQTKFVKEEEIEKE